MEGRGVGPIPLLRAWLAHGGGSGKARGQPTPRRGIPTWLHQVGAAEGVREPVAPGLNHRASVAAQDSLVAERCTGHLHRKAPSLSGWDATLTR